MQGPQGVHDASTRRREGRLRAEREDSTLDRRHQGTESHDPPLHTRLIRTVCGISHVKAVFEQGVEDSADTCCGRGPQRKMGNHLSDEEGMLG